MAWRPTEWVWEGELDNTTRGWTIGWIRLQDRDEPLRLKLAGNCHPDLAGKRFSISCTSCRMRWKTTRRIWTHEDGIAGGGIVVRVHTAVSFVVLDLDMVSLGHGKRQEITRKQA